MHACCDAKTCATFDASVLYQPLLTHSCFILIDLSSGGHRKLNIFDRTDLDFVDCATVGCGDTFATLTRDDLIDLVDAAVEPALGIAEDAQCSGQCCNGGGFLNQYGRIACGCGISIFPNSNCSPDGYDRVRADGCCMNYVASGIKGMYVY